MILRLGGFLPRSRVNGPGERAVLWVQGCARRCPGCHNPELLDADGPAEERDAEEVSAAILALPGLRGVTFSGGEPFAQARALTTVARCCHEAGRDVAVFTGFSLDELGAGGAEEAALLAETDLLIDGPYLAERPSTQPLCASENQRLHFLTGRITPADVAAMPAARLEVRVSPSGEIRVTGFPGDRFLEQLRKA